MIFLLKYIFKRKKSNQKKESVCEIKKELFYFFFCLHKLFLVCLFILFLFFLYPTTTFHFVKLLFYISFNNSYYSILIQPLFFS